MNPDQPPAGPFRHAYDVIFRQPISPDLEWHDMRILLGLVGQTSMAPDGSLQVARNGHVLLLPPPRERKVADSQALMEIRLFLQRSEVPLPPGTPDSVA